LLQGFESPDDIAAFVSGGGDMETPGSGFGGVLGDVTRFGSLLDIAGVNSLTRGNVDEPQQFRPFDVLGGQSPGLAGTTPATNTPAQPVPAGFSPLPPKSTVNTQAPAAMQGVQNANVLVQEAAKLSMWQPGNPDYDEVKKLLGGTASDSEIHQKLFNIRKRGILATRNGYTPGSPKFEDVRKQLTAEAIASVGDINGELAAAEAAVAHLLQSDPANPQLAEAKDRLKYLSTLRSEGVDDNTVMYHVVNNLPPEGDLSDYGALAAMRGDDTTTGVLLNSLKSPVTAPLIPKAIGTAHKGLTMTPGINKVPGFRPVAKQIFKEGEEALAEAAAKKSAKLGFKTITKFAPGVGIVLEIVDVNNTPADEMRAKFNDKLRQDPTLGNMAWYFADNVLSPGQNLAGAALTLKDAYGMVNDAKATTHRSELNRLAYANEIVDYLNETSKRRPLTAGEQVRLSNSQKAIAQLSADPKNSQLNSKLVVDNFRLEAKTHLSRLRRNQGLGSVDSVLSGTAGAEEVDAFNEWLDSQLDLVTPSIGGVPKLPWEDLGADISKLQEVAVRASAAGKPEVATRIMQSVRAAQEAKQRWDKNILNPSSTFDSLLNPPKLVLPGSVAPKSDSGVLPPSHGSIIPFTPDANEPFDW
jgi:hypothetical protein